MRLATVLLLVLFAAGTAGAMELRIEPPTDPVPPLQETRAVHGNLTAVCLPTDDGHAGVALAATAPAWAEVAVVPASIAAPETCEGTFTSSFQVLVSFRPEAPAFTGAPVQVSARASNGTAEDAANATFQAMPGFFSILDVSVDETIRRARPQTVVTYPLTVTNAGNGRTKVVFEVTDSSGRAATVTPLPVVVGPRGSPDATQVVPLTLMSPYENGYVNEQSSVTVRATSHFALDPVYRGDAATVSVVLATQGFYMPGPPLPALALALAGAAFLLRRR